MAKTAVPRGSIRGPQGIQGVQGVTGPAGPRGPGYARRYTDWRKRPTGQTIANTTLSDDGTAHYISPSGAGGSATTDGTGLKVTWPNSAGSAIYIQQNSGGTVRRIGATFGFGPSANATSGSFALATWTTDYPQGTTSAQCHLSMTASGWYFGVGVSGSVITLVTGTYAAPLAQDWTEYQAEVSMIGQTAYIALPDGTTTSVTDSRIASIAGYTACWEFYRDAGTTTVPLAFYDVWADVSAQAPMGVETPGGVAHTRIVNTTRDRAVLERGTTAGGTFTPVTTQARQRTTISAATALAPPATAGWDGQVIEHYFLATGASQVLTPTGFAMMGGIQPSMQIPVGKLGLVVMEYQADSLNRWIILDMRTEL